MANLLRENLIQIRKAKMPQDNIIPGYEIIASLLRGIAGNKMSYPPALITLSAPGTALLGFVMEDKGDPYLTIFVPTAPMMTTGAIHVVERSRVRPIEGSSIDAANCVTRWSLGPSHNQIFHSNGRGRDGDCSTPPAHIPACAANAHCVETPE